MRNRDSIGRGLRRRLDTLTALLPWALLILLPGAVRAQSSSLGPLGTSTQNPLYRLFYVPEAESADVVDAGDYRIELSTSYSNIFEFSQSAVHDELFDLEEMTTGLVVRWGVRPSLELGGRLGLVTTWGGFLDSFISGFHGAFGFPNGGRELIPNGQYHLYLDKTSPPVHLRIDRRTLDPEDVRIFAKWRFSGSAAEGHALSLRATVRRSAGPVQAGRMDGALALLGRLSRDPFHLHLAAGATTLTAPDALAPIVSDAAAFFTFGLETKLGERFSLVGQFVGESRYVGGFPATELSRMPVSLTFGFEGRTASRWGWGLSFAEDVPPNGPSVDFTVDLDVSKTF